MTRILSILLSALLALSPAYAQQTKSQLNTEVSTNYPDNTTGAITPAILRSTTNDIIASFQQAPTVNAQVSTTYTVQLSDYGKLVTFTNTNPIAVTLPQATGAFSTFNFYVLNKGAGTVTITPTTSTINGAASYAVPQNSNAIIVSDGTNYQVVAAGALPSISNNQMMANISGGSAAPVGVSAPSFFDSAYCNTIGYLIVRIASAWTCNNSIPANVDWFANVHGDGSSDDTAGINAVLAAVNGIVNFSSKVYCIKTATGLSVSTANQILQGTSATLISACGTDSNLLTVNADSATVRNLSFLGGGLSVSSTHHGIVLGTSCTRCRVDHVVVAGGYYNVLINAAYTFIYDLRTSNAHGPAAIKMLSSGGSSPGLYLDASQIDQVWPVSVPSNLASISARANSTPYTSGTVTSLTGYYIQAVGNCTSGNAPPSLQDYGTNIVDNAGGGTCTWKLVAPTTFDGLSVDTGSVNTVVTRSDFTGPYTNGIHLHNSAAGSAPIETDLGMGNTYAQNITACINAEAGSVLTIIAQQCQSGILTSTIGIWLKSTFTGNYQIESSAITNLGSASQGILDQASGVGSISNNYMSTLNNGIVLNAGVNNRSIVGNHAGASIANCIFVQSGASDYLNISNNDCNGATSAQLTVTGVTGIHNMFCHNGLCGSASSAGMQIFSPPVSVNFSAAGDTALPIPLPPGFTATLSTQINFSNCTASIGGATYGVNTATGGGGTALIAAGTAGPVTATTANTASNAVVVNVTNLNSQSYTPVNGAFQFRVGTTVASTCLVYATYRPAAL